MCRKSIFLLLVFFLLCGCELTLSEPYKFRYGIDQITNIEILEQNPVYSSWDDRFFKVKTLEPAQYEEFLTDLSSVKGQPFVNPPGDSFDLFVFCISYFNGEKEYISCGNNAYAIPGKGIVMDTYWFSDEKGFDAVISKYLEEDISEKREAWNKTIMEK